MSDEIDLDKLKLSGQLLWITTPGQEEKGNTYHYYNRKKGQSNSNTGLYNCILFFRFISEKNKPELCKRVFCVVQTSNSNAAFFLSLIHI